MSASDNRVFISTVSDEFEKPTAPFPGLRASLRHYLTAADCEVKVQEDFRQTTGGTVEKLDYAYIRRCAAVIHLVGEKPGAIADAADVAAYLSAVAADPGNRAFLDNQPALRIALGDFSGISYTQWEAFMALHHSVPLFVYAAPTAAGQQAHLDRLLLASPKKYASKFTDAADLLGQLIGDLRDIIPAVVPQQRIHPPKFLHHNAELFLGRDSELAFLDGAWTSGLNVLSLIAWGGVGKTALMVEWVQTRFINLDWKGTDTWPAPDAYFDWSFYDQGTQQRTGNVGDFFEVALKWFGDPDPNLPGKGSRLADRVQQQRTLLILDGLEPLQQPLGSPMAGRLLDPDLRDLLTALAASNPGLCLLTSRQPLADLDGLHGRTESKDLEGLSKHHAVQLLRKLLVTGSDQALADAVEKFDCHALSLTLLGRFLVDAHGGDIRRIDQVKLHEADDETRPERHRTVWKVMSSYNDWLQTASTQPETLAVLRLLGLFDRPATPDCLDALRKGDPIPGLTETLHALTDTRWRTLLQRLDRAHLLKLRDTSPNPQSLLVNLQSIDAHPLVREYFAEQLRLTAPEAYRAAHSRLFDHLCQRTEHRPDTLEALQPLYQAVSHGCLAGRQQEACDKVYKDRIQRGTGSGGHYSTNKLGAIGADLGAVAAFFEEPWTRLSPNLRAPAQAWLLNEAAFRLRALGRLTEALEPMRCGLNMRVETEDWKNAAISASNLSELEVTLGRLSEAVADGHRAIDFADRNGDAFGRMARRTTAADALHLAGTLGVASFQPPSSPQAPPLSSPTPTRGDEKRAAGSTPLLDQSAHALFAEAERLQAERQPEFPLLYSVAGFQYADLLLAPAERAAWLATLTVASASDVALDCGSKLPQSKEEALAACAEATRRATQTLEWAKTYHLSLLDIALDHLTLARAALYHALLTADIPPSEIRKLASAISTALTALRTANQSDELPKALLTAAFHAGTLGGDLPLAQRYLDEAQQIAERGPMPLYLADVHLHRARLFGRLPAAARQQQFPGLDPHADLATARRLIEHHGYGRRLPELTAAEAAAVAW